MTVYVNNASTCKCKFLLLCKTVSQSEHTHAHPSRRALRVVYNFCIIVYFCFLLVLFLFVLF